MPTIRVKQIYVIAPQERKEAEEDMNVALKLVENKDIIEYNIFPLPDTSNFWGYIKYFKKIKVDKTQRSL